MKKILFTILVFAFCIGIQGQKITALTEATTAPTGSLLIVRSGTTGDVLKRITEANLFSPLLKVKDSTAYVNSYMSRFDAVTGLALKVNISDTAGMLTRYARLLEVYQAIADSLNALRNSAVSGVLLADSANGAGTAGHWVTGKDFNTDLATRVKLVPDTVQHDADFTLALTDLNKDVYCLKATPKMTITIPTTASVAIPIGSTFNFYCEGASLLHFHAASGVSLHSDMDSVTTSRIHQVVGLKKRGNNYWILYGPLTD
jgi:hypothetical protein